MQDRIAVEKSENTLVIERIPPEGTSQHVVVPEEMVEELIEQIASEAGAIRSVELQVE